MIPSIQQIQEEVLTTLSLDGSSTMKEQLTEHQHPYWDNIMRELLYYASLLPPDYDMETEFGEYLREFGILDPTSPKAEPNHHRHLYSAQESSSVTRKEKADKIRDEEGANSAMQCAIPSSNKGMATRKWDANQDGVLCSKRLTHSGVSIQQNRFLFKKAELDSCLRPKLTPSEQHEATNSGLNVKVLDGKG